MEAPNTTTPPEVVAKVVGFGNSWDDATWILTSSFVIFTMQSGFGLLESGMVSRKNEVNIMVKNSVDVIFGGLSYWVFGYAFSFGTDPGTNWFCGVGMFFTDSDSEEMGWIFAKFVFQASFATTATTIVSGAMAERTKLESYCMVSLFNTFIYCFPAHWIWAEEGVFHKMGVIDIAGAGAVHLVGGITGLVATLMLKPRRGRFDGTMDAQMSNPTNALLGMFMLWWGWLGFNCGSTFGISGGKWKLATRAAVTTLTASIGGGITGIVGSRVVEPDGRKYDINYLTNGVLGGLVSITCLCALCRPWEGLVIGAVGGFLAISTPWFIARLKIDDPVGVIGVHVVAATWGLLSAGLFAVPDEIELINSRRGLLHGGGFELLLIQMLMAVVVITWTAITSFILLLVVEKTMGLRCSVEHEILGADIVEHGINSLSEDERRDVIHQFAELGHSSPFDKLGNYIPHRKGEPPTALATISQRRRSTVITVSRSPSMLQLPAGPTGGRHHVPGETQAQEVARHGLVVHDLQEFAEGGCRGSINLAYVVED